MEPAASLQGDHRPRRVLGGVLQELRGELQEIRPAVGEARRQTVGSARLSATASSSSGLVVVVVMVVMVAVRHHPPHQCGHGVLNFADHRRRRRSITGTKATRLSERGPISRRRSRGPGRGSFQEERLFPPPRPHVTAAGEVAGCAGCWARRGVFFIHVRQRTQAGRQAHTHARARTQSIRRTAARSLARSLVRAGCDLAAGFYMATSKQQGVAVKQAGRQGTRRQTRTHTHAHTRM